MTNPYRDALVEIAAAEAATSAIKKNLLRALRRLVGTPDDPNNGWHAHARTSQEHFRCEYCHVEHLDCVELPHALDCPALEARAALAAAEHCQCAACRDGVIHDSCCAVHNEPAMPVGPCDCSIEAARRAAALPVEPVRGDATLQEVHDELMGMVDAARIASYDEGVEDTWNEAVGRGTDMQPFYDKSGETREALSTRLREALAGLPQVNAGAPGATDAERAAWLADKIVAGGDYAKEAASMLRRWPAVNQGESGGGG